eukprot:NODE_1947_length_2329_cov_3.673025.p1 GENE.NODE_1947_length_2329_cov_3.673025~~NODE_1947_length_2329_cov_3.673025.p1  ORF type:complete len:505 (+),score=137.59 NODE_1947_length_2329_cov_3.673025:678-2192(+)
MGGARCDLAAASSLRAMTAMLNSRTAGPCSHYRRSWKSRMRPCLFFFRVVVVRTRFTVEVLLRTRFEEPVPACPYSVRTVNGDLVCEGCSSRLGVVCCDVPRGTFELRLDPPESLPFVATAVELRVHPDASFSPLEARVSTKTTLVEVMLVTPDGEPAPDCVFHLKSLFQASSAGTAESSSASDSRPPSTARAVHEMRLRSNGEGVAIANLGMLEPYTFEVKPTGKADEYMPQRFAFQVDRKNVMMAVARSIFGKIQEERLCFLIDVSCSMQSYLWDVRVALQQLLVQQLHGTSKKFNLMAFSQNVELFRRSLVESSTQNVEDGMAFCDTMVAGGTTEIVTGMTRALKLPSVEVVYLVTDGKSELKSEALEKIRQLHLSAPTQPRVRTIGINCIPRRAAWRGLEAAAELTEGSFRPVCLEQDLDTVATRPTGLYGALSGLDLSPKMLLTEDEGVFSPGEEGPSDSDGEVFAFTSAAGGEQAGISSEPFTLPGPLGEQAAITSLY